MLLDELMLMDDQMENVEPVPLHGEFFLAKLAVSSTSSYPRTKLIFDGETAATQKYYPVLNKTAIAVGTRVLVLKLAGSYIVLGQVQSV